MENQEIKIISHLPENIQNYSVPLNSPASYRQKLISSDSSSGYLGSLSSKYPTSEGRIKKKTRRIRCTEDLNPLNRSSIATGEFQNNKLSKKTKKTKKQKDFHFLPRIDIDGDPLKCQENCKVNINVPEEEILQEKEIKIKECKSKYHRKTKSDFKKDCNPNIMPDLQPIISGSETASICLSTPEEKRDSEVEFKKKRKKKCMKTNISKTCQVEEVNENLKRKSARKSEISTNIPKPNRKSLRKKSEHLICYAEKTKHKQLLDDEKYSSDDTSFELHEMSAAFSKEKLSDSSDIHENITDIKLVNTDQIQKSVRFVNTKDVKNKRGSFDLETSTVDLSVLKAARDTEETSTDLKNSRVFPKSPHPLKKGNKLMSSKWFTKKVDDSKEGSESETSRISQESSRNIGLFNNYVSETIIKSPKENNTRRTFELERNSVDLSVLKGSSENEKLSSHHVFTKSAGLPNTENKLTSKSFTNKQEENEQRTKALDPSIPKPISQRIVFKTPTNSKMPLHKFKDSLRKRNTFEMPSPIYNFDKSTKRSSSLRKKVICTGQNEPVISLLTPSQNIKGPFLVENTSVVSVQNSTLVLKDNISSTQLSTGSKKSKSLQNLTYKQPSKLNRSLTFIKDGDDNENSVVYVPGVIDTSKVTKRRRWNKSLSASILDSSGKIQNISSPWNEETLPDISLIESVSGLKSQMKSPWIEDTLPDSLFKQADNESNIVQEKDTPIKTKQILEKNLKSFTPMLFKPHAGTSTPIPDKKTNLLRQALLKENRTVTFKKNNNSSIVPSNLNSKRKKMPNFALIHQRAFDKLEDLKEMSERKAVRAKLLLSGRKPGVETNFKLKTYSKTNKILKYSPTILNTLAAIKPEMADDLMTQVNVVLPSISNPGVGDNFRSFDKKAELSKIMSRIPRPVKSKVSAQKCFTQNGNAMKNKASKEQQVKAVATKSKPNINTIDNRRNILQHVRSNRRFELLMKMRNKK